MNVRLAIVNADLSELNVSEFCRLHGIGRTRFYELRKRYEAEGIKGLEDRSRAPLTVTNRTSPETEEKIVLIRKRLSDDGLDAGPATIHWHLERDDGVDPVPSEATIWRLLDKRGFIDKNAKKRPKSSWTSFQKERRNELWQIDSWEWQLTDGTRVDIIDLIDDCTRKALGSKAVAGSTNTAQALDCVLQAGNRWGLPERVLSDNGSCFVSMTNALHKIGIATTRSRVYHPQTCGKVERFHQTLKNYLTAQDPAETIQELQTQIDTFIDYYNNERPHRSLGRRTPSQTWDTTPASGPSDKPIDAPTQVWTSIVHLGRVAAGKQHKISVGTKYNLKEATIVITGTKCHVFIDGQPVRQLEIDPTRYRYTHNNKPDHSPNR